MDGIEVRPPAYGSRIVVKLNWDVAPLACENFATLCTNGNTTLLDPTNTGPSSNNLSKKVKTPIGQCGKPLTYKDSTIHRIEPGFIMQGGDFVFGNGSGGESIYNGKKFKDEKAGLQLKHDKKGILSMGNSGKNSNTSQFFITFQKTPQCDGKHVIFGEVVSGFEVLDAIEKAVDTSNVNGEPKLSPVQITDCGAFYPFQTPGAGFWFDQPDVESFNGYTPVFVTRPRITIVTPTRAAYDKFTKFIGSYAAVTTACLATCHDDDSSSAEENILDKVNEQLSSFSVDVVLVAPAYSDLFKSFDLPASWKKHNYCYEPETHEVILVAKPIDALKAIKERAWVGKITSWQLDGNI